MPNDIINKHRDNPPVVIRSAPSEDNTTTAAAKTGDTTNAGNESHLKKSSSSVVVKFGSAEKGVAAEVAADIEECDRINGAEDFFGSAGSRFRNRLKPAYKTFRRANSDPAYCAELVKQLTKKSGGTYTPSKNRPACLGATVALKPETEAHMKQTYDASYYFLHAAIEEVSLDGFPAWIEGRNLKESIAFVRARKNYGRKPKAKPYPNIAKAKKLKGHPAAAKILKDALDMAEDELAKLFEGDPVETTTAA